MFEILYMYTALMKKTVRLLICSFQIKIFLSEYLNSYIVLYCRAGKLIVILTLDVMVSSKVKAIVLQFFYCESLKKTM